MSVFKHFEPNETLLERSVKDYNLSFDNTAFLNSDGGWESENPDSYDQYSNITGNLLFVREEAEGDVKFSIGFAEEDGNDGKNLLWNMIMSSIMTPWDSENEQYNFYVGNTRITKSIVLSLNPDVIKDGISDNFVVVFNDTYDSGDPLYQSLTLAPYYDKKSFEDRDNISSKISPALELRSNDDDNFVTLNESEDSIKVDWNIGNKSDIYGVVYPSLGIVLVFPELIPNTEDEDLSTIDSSQNALDTLSLIGGYNFNSFDRFVYFFRLKNNEFNYSNNPTSYKYVDGKPKKLDKLRLERGGEPTTFITRIGYYNDYNECLAVGFFEHPLKKSVFDENIIISQIDI